VDSATIYTASIEPRHRGRDTAFVQENQVFRRDRTDALDELFPSSTVGLGVALGGVERLFFRRTPNASARSTPERCTTDALLLGKNPL